MRRDDGHVFLGHAVQQPLAVALDVDGGVLGFLRCLIRANDLGRSLFDGDVRRDELDGIRLRLQLGPFRLGEDGGKLLFDRLAADDLLAAERIRVDGFGRPHRRQGLRVRLG